MEPKEVEGGWKRLTLNNLSRGWYFGVLQRLQSATSFLRSCIRVDSRYSYGQSNYGLLTLSSCSFQKAAHISESALSQLFGKLGRHIGRRRRCPYLSIVALTTTLFPLLWTPTCIRSQPRSLTTKNPYVPKPPISTPCVPAILLTWGMVSIANQATNEQGRPRNVLQAWLRKHSLPLKQQWKLGRNSYYIPRDFRQQFSQGIRLHISPDRDSWCPARWMTLWVECWYYAINVVSRMLWQG